MHKELIQMSLFPYQRCISRICFAVASIVMFCYLLSACEQKADTTLPMKAEEVSSVAVYRLNVFNEVKKVVTDPQDIAALVETINGATVGRILDPKNLDPSDVVYGGSSYEMAFYLSDGSVVCRQFSDYGEKAGRYRDTSQYFEVSNLDIASLWSKLNYEEQEALYTEEPAFDDLVTLEFTNISTTK